MSEIALWTILIGTLASVGCSLVGCFLVLRKMSLLGDAISHAVLPGIAIGFMLSGKISGPAIVLGAMGMGLVTAYFTQMLSRSVRVSEDASLGVVFTSLFALGVVLYELKARSVDLDPGCVLYGAIEYAPLDITTFLGVAVPESVITLGLTLLLIVVAIIVTWKELKLASFDPELATALGFSSQGLHYFLMTLTAGVTVAAFEAVGSILVVAMLIVPATTAQLLTDRLRTMLILAALVATLSTILGYYGAEHWNTSVAGMMAVAAGVLFLAALFVAPKYGLISRVLKQLRLSLRIYREDILGALYRAQEKSQSGMASSELLPTMPAIMRWIALRSLRRHGLIESAHSMLSLTRTGKDQAMKLVRAHRLWETYLQQNVALPADHLHEPAEKMEHFVGPALLDTLAEDLQQPARDPHGRVIPVQKD